MNNIILIGMPGSGKSTLGILLAKAIGYHFMDTDLLIQNFENDLLQNIIDTQGIAYFKEIERIHIQKINTHRTVIATGGSVVYGEDTMAFLSQLGTLIYLDASYDTIENRINNITTRGIAMSPHQTLKQLYDERKPLYEKYANYSIQCDQLTTEDTVHKLVHIFNHLLQ